MNGKDGITSITGTTIGVGNSEGVGTGEWLVDPYTKRLIKLYQPLFIFS